MKVGILGDIHANLHALTQVVRALLAEKCARILCVGDVVGYGPRPNECIDLLKAQRVPCILGNHDEWMFSQHVVLGINDNTRYMIHWTRQALTPERRDWLRQLPPRHHYGGIDLVHASNAIAEHYWPYVRDDKTLRENFTYQKGPICFCGHTHVPAIGVHLSDDENGFIKIDDRVVIPEGYRALINPGSVGQPRDGDPRAACAVFETKDRSVRFLRVEYNVAQTQKEMRAAGLPDVFIKRLETGH